MAGTPVLLPLPVEEVTPDHAGDADDAASLLIGLAVSGPGSDDGEGGTADTDDTAAGGAGKKRPLEDGDGGGGTDPGPSTRPLSQKAKVEEEVVLR